MTATANAGYETGSANQVMRVPGAGGRAKFGQVNVSSSAAITGQVPIANGGTGAATKAAGFDALSPLTTGGDLLYGGASGTGTRLANGASGQVLTSSGGTAAPSWTTLNTTLYTPNIQAFTSSSGTYGLSYWFIVSSANATAGATYTNNSATFTVARTISGATTLLMTSTGTPAASGTLTKVSGTGDSTITFTSNKAPLYLIIRVVGGGGGGGGGSTSGSTGSVGSSSTFGSSLLIANGGGAGLGGASYTNANSGGAGGTATVAAPAIQEFAVSGGKGGPASNATTGQYLASGAGGNSCLGGSSSGTTSTVTAGATNTGSGGEGGGSGTAQAYGGGGGAGGCLRAFIYSPNSTYAFSVGGGGSGGAGTTTGAAGGSGLVSVEEHFQ